MTVTIDDNDELAPAVVTSGALGADSRSLEFAFASPLTDAFCEVVTFVRIFEEIDPSLPIHDPVQSVPVTASMVECGGSSGKEVTISLPSDAADLDSAHWVGVEFDPPEAITGGWVAFVSYSQADSSQLVANRPRDYPLFRVGDASVMEAPGAALAFAVTLSGPREAYATVDYATVTGTAQVGVDYQGSAGTLVFAPGETSKTVAVTVVDDDHDEGSETLKLTLSNAVGALKLSMEYPMPTTLSFSASVISNGGIPGNPRAVSRPRLWSRLVAPSVVAGGR